MLISRQNNYLLMTMRKNIYGKIALMLIISVLMVSNLTILECLSGKINYYAEIFKYPLPSIPEPVLDGSEFYVKVKMPSSTIWINAIVYNEIQVVNASLIEASYNNKTGIWYLKFDLPSGLREGAYNLNITYKPSENESTKILNQPRCLWILPQWPEKLVILACGDVKPEGIPYWKEMVYEANLINPDLIIFLGDLVNVPNVASEWIKFLEPFKLILDPIYVTAGNHEYSGLGVANIYKRIMGPVNYTVTIGKFLLICLDTDRDGWIRMERLKWAENILKRNIDKTKIMFFHFPLFNVKLKEKGTAYFKISSIEDFNNLVKQNAIAETWGPYLDEAKELFRLIIEYDVRLILSEHIHTDFNVIVENINTGKKHYFISPAALAYDIPDHDIRGFKLITIYANGTIIESTLYYPGTGMFNYPNSIPIDSGTTTYYRPVLPYKIGFLEYYYAPANDGKHYAVSLKINNELKVSFNNPRIIFKLPADIPIERYEWKPFKPEYEVITVNGIHYVILRNINIPSQSQLTFTVYAVEDKDKPKVNLVDVPSLVDKGSWIQFKVEAIDNGWGIRDIEVKYTVNDKEWKNPDLMDFIEAENGKVIYKVWIKAPNIDTKMKIKAKAVDFSDKTSDEVTKEIIVGKPPKAKYNLKITSSPIEGISFKVNGTKFETPTTITLEEGTYVIEFKGKVKVNDEEYEFTKWSDGTTNPKKIIKLNKNMELTVYYEQILKPQQPTPPPEEVKPQIPWTIIIAGIVIAIAIVIIVIYKIKGK